MLLRCAGQRCVRQSCYQPAEGGRRFSAGLREKRTTTGPSRAAITKIQIITTRTFCAQAAWCGTDSSRHAAAPAGCEAAAGAVAQVAGLGAGVVIAGIRFRCCMRVPANNGVSRGAKIYADNILTVKGGFCQPSGPWYMPRDLSNNLIKWITDKPCSAGTFELRNQFPLELFFDDYLDGDPLAVGQR